MSDRNPYTHGYGAPVLTSHRARTAANSAAHLLPHLRPGQRLLDVGSGAGTITADLARIVGPENVTALEVAEEARGVAVDDEGEERILGVVECCEHAQGRQDETFFGERRAVRVARG